LPLPLLQGQPIQALRPAQRPQGRLRRFPLPPRRLARPQRLGSLGLAGGAAGECSLRGRRQGTRRGIMEGKTASEREIDDALSISRDGPLSRVASVVAGVSYAPGWRSERGVESRPRSPLPGSTHVLCCLRDRGNRASAPGSAGRDGLAGTVAGKPSLL